MDDRGRLRAPHPAAPRRGGGCLSAFVVVAGGDPIDATWLEALPPDRFVIAADSGLDHAVAMGLRVDLVVGDLDSVSPAVLAAFDAAPETLIERHPTDKDAIDLELALDAAVARGATSITVLGGHGGRLDHLIANALLLTSPRYATAAVVAHMGSATVSVIRGEVELRGASGDTVTLLAVAGVADGVSTTGLRYALDDDMLLPGSSRGVSNELLGTTAVVSVGSGVVLAVQPGG